MKEIGKYLKAKRIEKGLTIEEIEKETKILAVFLDAIENENTSVFGTHENFDGILSFYAHYLGLNKNALITQEKILKMQAIRGATAAPAAAASAPQPASFKELIPALEIIKERQRVSIDLLEIHFGSYAKAKEICEYLNKNEFIAKPKGSYEWMLNNEKINEYLGGKR